MLGYLYDHHKLVADFVAQLIPHCRAYGFGPKAKAIGVIDRADRNSLIGGIVYNNWEPDAGVIELSGAAITPRWLTRETIRRMYQYPFLQLGCQMIVQRTPADNEHLLGQLAAFGYQFIRVPRLMGPHRDCVLCLLTYEDWCGNKFNKRFKHHVIESETKEAA